MAAFCVASILARDGFVWMLRNTALLPKKEQCRNSNGNYFYSYFHTFSILILILNPTSGYFALRKTLAVCVTSIRSLSCDLLRDLWYNKLRSTTRQDYVFHQIRLLENESHCEQQWLILETTHTNDSHASYCPKHSTSYQNGRYSEQQCSTSVLAQTTLEEKCEI